VLLDDGWPACAEWSDPSKPEASGCANPAPRHDNGDVPVDERKFPPSGPGANDGIKVVADYLHAKGLKMGIYTAPHGRTCGGYWGMLGHEATDSQMYANWGIVSGQQRPLGSPAPVSDSRPSLAAGLPEAGHGLPRGRFDPRRHGQGLARARARRPEQNRPTRAV